MPVCPPTPPPPSLQMLPLSPPMSLLRPANGTEYPHDSLNCCLPNGYQIVILHNVLYVPTLGHKLVSWNMLRELHKLKGVHNLSDNADYLYVYNRDKDNLVFMAKYIDNFPYLCLSTQSAFPVEESDPREVDQHDDADNELDNEVNGQLDNAAGSGTPAAAHKTSAREVTSAITQEAMYWHVVL